MGGLGRSSQKQDKQIPRWEQEAAIDQLHLGKALSTLGYTPWMGPDVAAFSPMQVAGMQGTNTLAEAFGMPSVGNPMMGLPAPSDFGGLLGYSSFPMYQQSLMNLQNAFPGQAQYLASFTNNPFLGGFGGRFNRDD
jgi:hypothetical protein